MKMTLFIENEANMDLTLIAFTRAQGLLVYHLTKEGGTSRQTFEIELADACYNGFGIRHANGNPPQLLLKIESLEFLELTPNI